MTLGSPAQVAQVLLLLIGGLTVTAFARKKGWPAPPLVVAVGLLVSFIPGIPQFEIEPDLLLGVVLPPLLYSAALESSSQDFKQNLTPILSLGVGLVVFSTVAVAVVASLLIPGLPVAVALVLGAVLAPPDAVAAVAIGRKLNLPPVVMSIISGESLINDGSALTLYKVGLAAAAGASGFMGSGFIGTGLVDFGLAVGVGVGIGLVVAVPVQWIRVRLDDPVLESVIGLTIPFGTYLLANALEGSGVLAVVVAGLYLGRNSPRAGYASRLQEQPLWTTVSLLLEALVFGLIGLQLRFVVTGVAASGRPLSTVLGICAGVFLTAVAARFVWIFGVSWVQGAVRHGIRSRAAPWRAYLVVSWAGMRGVVTLAAAAAIPLTVGSPAVPFPDRDLIVLLAFVVTVGTLLLQGLTLPVLIRSLHLQQEPDPAAQSALERHLAEETRKAAEARLQELEPRWEAEMGAAPARALVERTRQMLERRQRMMGSADRSDEQAEAAVSEDGRLSHAERTKRVAEVVRAYVTVQREVLVRERNAGHVDEDTMRRMLRDLDYQEAFVADMWEQRL